jgi:hypothetical protein
MGGLEIHAKLRFAPLTSAQRLKRVFVRAAIGSILRFAQNAVAGYG